VFLRIIRILKQLSGVVIFNENSMDPTIDYIAGFLSCRTPPYVSLVTDFPNEDMDFVDSSLYCTLSVRRMYKYKCQIILFSPIVD